MAPTRCCPICPHELLLSSGLYRHHEACNQYKEYMAACRELRQQVTMDAGLRFRKMPKTLHNLEATEHEPEGMQLDNHTVSHCFVMSSAYKSSILQE